MNQKTMIEIQNPVLPGFHPDPSILRVGDDYYIANSTFEWQPGVVIHHSLDLVNWRLIGHALTGNSSPNLAAVDNSSGIWAPSLSYADGQFWLIYTEVRTRVGPFKDLKNFLVSSESILGPWSAPVFLNSSGFDPSLFHDEISAGGDGRKWLINMRWDFRQNHPSFDGIIAQEYDPVSRALVGPITTLLQKDRLIEGPNLYKVNGAYFLMLAEGGTGWNHGISMARSKSLTGPYEVDPVSLLMTSRGDDGAGDPAIALQKSGHGELVQTARGEWYVVHLASRPLGSGANRRCILGRETCLQKVEWTADGWLRLVGGGTEPKINVAPPIGAPILAWPEKPVRDDFDAGELSSYWSSLRTPVDSTWISLSDRPGWIRLIGRESIHSFHEQSLVAQRVQSFHITAETCLEFEPRTSNHLAGLICWYDTRTHYFLRVTRDDGKKVVGIILTDDGKYDELAESDLQINDWKRIFLRAVIGKENLEFFASPDGVNWNKIGPTLDSSKLSDDYGQGLHFTGAMIGLCAQDIDCSGCHADFDYFVLKNNATHN
jgi:xylan 1,4-beta-xylosidase